MKTTLATLSLAALLIGCVSDDRDFAPDSPSLDGLEFVVIEAEDDDTWEYELPDGFDVPAFPGEQDLVSDTDYFEREIPDVPGGLDRPEIGESEAALVSGADNLGREFPGERELAGDDADDDQGREYPGERELASDDGASMPPADPCKCRGTECLERWIAWNVGCNVCATFVCGDHNSGACYMC